MFIPLSKIHKKQTNKKSLWVDSAVYEERNGVNEFGEKQINNNDEIENGNELKEAIALRKTEESKIKRKSLAEK